MAILNINELTKKSPASAKRKRLTPQRGFITEYKEGFESVISPSPERNESVIKDESTKTESVISPSLERNQSVIKNDSVKTESVIKASSESVIKASSKKIDHHDISRLAPSIEKILFSLVNVCQLVASNVTPKLSNNDLLKMTGLQQGTVRNGILKLRNAKLLNVLSGSFGPNSYRIYEIPLDVYQSVLSSSAYHYFGRSFAESVIKASSESVIKASSNAPNNNNLNNNLLDLENINRRFWDSVKLPEFFFDFEFPKDNLKFSQSKLDELKEKWILKSGEQPEIYTPENLQDSLFYIAYDLQYSKDFWIDRLGGLFSALKKPYDKPKNFLTIAEKQKAALNWVDEMTKIENIEKVWFQISQDQKDTYLKSANIALNVSSKNGTLALDEDILRVAKNLAIENHFNLI